MADEQGADGADSGLSTTETTPKMVPLTELQAERAKVREAREALRELQKEHGERGDAFTALQERIKALEPLEAELTRSHIHNLICDITSHERRFSGNGLVKHYTHSIYVLWGRGWCPQQLLRRHVKKRARDIRASESP